MFLDELNAWGETQLDVAKATVIDIVPKTVYYLYRGRNAWNSKWVQHYYPKCLSTKDLFARENAERLRGNGNTFTIQQLPALAVQTEIGVIVITEINTENPLSGYSPDAVKERPDSGLQLIDGAKSNYFYKGADANAFVLSFDRKSRFWKRIPNPKNSILMMFNEGMSLDDLEPLESKLTSKKSRSWGTKYMLGWEEGSSVIKSKAVRELAVSIDDHPDSIRPSSRSQ